jgi:hypothetical protein
MGWTMSDYTTDTDAPDGKLSDEALLKEIRDYCDEAIRADAHNRAPAVADLQFLVGEQWPEDIRRQRQLEGRPCLTFNRLPTFLHQVTNDQRQNKPGIKTHPVDGGADLKRSEINQGVIRHIEYISNADIAYDTAVNSAAAIGFGFWRLITEYESPMSFDQVIRYQRIRDALKVFMDPASTEADGSDQKRCAIIRDVPRKEFKRQYPQADEATSTAIGLLGQQVQQGWMNENYVREVEYYYFEYTSETLCMLEDGSIVFEKDLPDGAMVKQRRESQIPQLMWCKATAGAILERTKIMCRWIPVFPVWGNEVDIQGKVFRSGIIRDAKDPAQMYNFWMTSATEEVSLRPKTPFIGAEGQFEGHEKQWGQANSRTFAYLEYKPVSLGGQLAPPPQRSPMADVPAGMLQMAIHASDNIKAVTGLFDSSIGARGNATSGVQERAQQKQGDTANFHYTDNLNRSIRHCGRCLIDMIPHYYDAQRVVRMMKEDGTIESAEVNVQKVDPITQQVTEVLNDMTIGTYDVTVSTGPSYSTQREEAAEAMVSMAGDFPKLMEVAGDLVVESMDFPGADKIAARLKKTMPAELTKDDDGTGEDQGPPPLPPEIEQHIQQADQMIDQLQGALKEAQSGIEKAHVDAASREQVALIQAASAARVAEINAGVLMDKEELITLRAQLAHHQRLEQQEQVAGHQVAAAEQAAGHTAQANEQSAELAAEASRTAASQAAESAQNGPTEVISGS